MESEGFVITNELKRVSRTLFLRFVSITNERGEDGEEVSCAQWKTDSQAGFNSFHRAADFRQCRHSTDVSTTQTLVPPFRSPPRPFQRGNRFPPKRAFACHRPPNEHGPSQPFKTAKTVILLLCFSFSLLPSSARRIRNREEFSSNDSSRRGFARVPLINRDDKRIRFSASSRSTAISHPGTKTRFPLAAAS